MITCKINKYRILTIFLVINVFVILFAFSVLASQCNDAVDNDCDGNVDLNDNGCSNSSGNSEDIFIGYANGCLHNGDKLRNGCGTIIYECEHDLCSVCVLMKERGNYTTIFSRCYGLPACGFGSGNGGGGFDTTPPVLTINSPQQNAIYSSRSVLVDISVNEKSDIYYYDNINGEAWIRLCNDCQGYNRKKSFKEGLNNITIRATDVVGNSAYYDLAFFVDSKKPKIKKTLPKKGFADGNFEVQFQEENPISLVLHYGNSQTGERSAALGINNDCELENKKYFCNKFVSLNDYNEQQISYYFELEDIAGATLTSKLIYLDVDTSAPVIDSLLYNQDGKYITFNADITETNFNSMVYTDELTGKEGKICTRLIDGKCIKKISFSSGEHLLTIQADDKAGNAVTWNEQISFIV